MHHIDLKHDGLKKFRRLSGTNRYVLEQRARIQREKWEERWRRRALLDSHSDELLRQLPNFEAQKAHAARLTAEAQQIAASLGNILARGLEASPFKMEMLYDSSIFPEPRPIAPVDELPPPAPKRGDRLFQDAKIDLKHRLPLLLLRGKHRREMAAQWKEEAIQSQYELAYAQWQAATEAIARQNAWANALFEMDLDAWWERAQAYQKRQQEENKEIDRFRLRYAQGRADAVIEFLDAALSHADYPDMFPMRWELGFVPETGTLIVDYELPAPESFPTLKAVKYDVMSDSFAQTHESETELAQLYESALYQTCLRSLHDMFAADEAEVISSITFNGWVNFTDKVRDTPERACILSVQATKPAILQANLLAIDPKSYFKKLKGVAGLKLADLAAVVPIIWLKRPDEPSTAASAADQEASTQSPSPSSPAATPYDPGTPPSPRQ